MSRQVMVAIPRWALRRLGVRAGVDVWWHRHRAGELVLTAKQRRSAGQPGRRDLEEELARTIEERDDWKRQAVAQEHGTYREGHAHGYEAAIRQYGSITNRLDLVLDLVRALRPQTPAGRRAARRLVQRAVEQLVVPDAPQTVAEVAGLPPGVVAINLDPPS